MTPTTPDHKPAPATDEEIAEWNPADRNIAAAVYPWKVAKLIARISADRAELAAAKDRFAHDIDSRDHAYALLEAERQRLHDQLAAAKEEIASKDREIDRLDLRWQEVNDQLAAAKEEIANLRKRVAIEASMATDDEELRYVAQEAIERHLAARARKEGGSRG